MFVKSVSEKLLQWRSLFSHPTANSMTFQSQSSGTTTHLSSPLTRGIGSGSQFSLQPLCCCIVSFRRVSCEAKVEILPRCCSLTQALGFLCLCCSPRVSFVQKKNQMQIAARIGEPRTSSNIRHITNVRARVSDNCQRLLRPWYTAVFHSLF